MRESLTSVLRCPSCRTDGALRLAATHKSDDREVREGGLSCARCGGDFPIVDGIAELMPYPPEFVVRESAGLDRFAEEMRADGWDRERILALPDVDLPYWQGQARAMRALLETVAFVPGRRLLDVGSNTCWASNIFAARGLEVVALDISSNDLQGLRAADHFLDRGDVFFERMRSVMFAPALASESMDYVFCCEVLHHNDSAHLERTLHELYRVLRPGGRLLVVNEPLRFPLLLKRDHGCEVAQFEGNEHVYFLHQYYFAARRAGFKITIPALRKSQDPANSSLKSFYRFGRSLWRNLISGDTALMMDCTRGAGAGHMAGGGGSPRAEGRTKS
jgi:SAM-dependent methyltransferase/uncharacterized protein YbaR (Trm112 family)